MKKRGFFLTVDAFLAIAVLVIGIILFMSNISSSPYRSQAVFFSEDLIDTFSSNKIYEFNQGNLTYLKKYRDDGNITNFRNTLLGQDLEFLYRYEKGCTSCLEMAQNLTGEIVRQTLNPDYSANISMIMDGGATVYQLYFYEHKASDDKVHKIENSNLVYSTRRIVVESIDTENFIMGTTEVTLWQ